MSALNQTTGNNGSGGGRASMASTGQLRTQVPQPRHLSSS